MMQYIIVKCLFQWELFRLPELECYDAMLTRLFRQEVEQIVWGYEAYRQSLHKHLDTRKQDKPTNPQQALNQNTVETKV